VYVSSGTVAKVGDDNTVGILGVVCEDIAASDYGWVYIEGVFKVKVNGTVDFALLDPVYSAASQKVDDGSSNDVAIGYIVNENPASGASEVYIAIRSTLLSSTTHS